MAKKEEVFRVNLNSFKDAHQSADCGGHFKLSFTTNAVFSQTALGPIRLPVVPMVVCHSCHAGYIVPEFRNWVEKRMAEKIIKTPGFLMKKQIRFLRQVMDYTQEELAHKIHISDRHELSKMESPKTSKSMSEDKQLRLKILVAKFLGIDKADLIYDLNESMEDSEINLKPESIASTKEIKSLFKTA